MAYEEKRTIQDAPHNVVMEGRRKLAVSGVNDVESFNEDEVVMASSQWALIVRGADLHMEKLSVDSGDVIITGRIDALEYEDGAPASEGFFSRLFK